MNRKLAQRRRARRKRPAILKFVIDLEIECTTESAAHAYALVNDVLDAGHLQEAINAHDGDYGKMRVASALCRLAPPSLRARLKTP